MTRKIVLIGIYTLLSFGTKAQTTNDPIYINFSDLPKADYNSRNGKTGVLFLECYATDPAIKIGKKIKVFNAVYYRNSNFEHNTTFPESMSFPATLHDIRYSAIIRSQLSTRWELVTIPRIMLRSDLTQPVNGNDFFPQVVVLATYAIKGNPNFKIGIGGALNNDFRRNAIVPLGSLNYESKKVKIEIVLPNAHFMYKSSENFEFGLFASLDGAISRVSPYQIGSETSNYYRTFQLLVAPAASHRIYKQIFGHLKMGFVPIRSFENMDKDFKAIEDNNFDLKSGLFLRTGISYRLKK